MGAADDMDMDEVAAGAAHDAAQHPVGSEAGRIMVRVQRGAAALAAAQRLQMSVPRKRVRMETRNEHVRRQFESRNAFGMRATWLRPTPPQPSPLRARCFRRVAQRRAAIGTCLSLLEIARPRPIQRQGRVARTCAQHVHARGAFSALSLAKRRGHRDGKGHLNPSV